MDAYLVVKAIHVISSAVLFGTGIGLALYLVLATLQRDARASSWAGRGAVIADTFLILPAAIVQPVTGYRLAEMAGIPFEARWLHISVALYVLAGVCWVARVWIQRGMRGMAGAAADSGAALPERHGRLARAWLGLEAITLLALAIVFYLMVAKPA